MIEEAEREFDAEHRADGAIEIRLWQRALVHTVDECLLKDIVRKIVELPVDTGADGETCGIFRPSQHSYRTSVVTELPGSRISSALS